MTGEVRARLKARNAAFKTGDMVMLKTARANLNWAIRAAKRAYSQKIQGFFSDPTNTNHRWQGIKTVTDWKATPLSCEDNINFLMNLIHILDGLRH